MYVQVSLKLPTEKYHSLTPRNSLWSFVALDIHVQPELAKSYKIRVLKWNTLKLRNRWHRSEDKLEFSFHICHWHFCDHDEFSKNVSLKDWLPEFEWVSAQSLHGQQRRHLQSLSSRKTWVTFKRCCSSLLIRKEACGEYCRLRQSNFEIPN